MALSLPRTVIGILHADISICSFVLYLIVLAVCKRDLALLCMYCALFFFFKPLAAQSKQLFFFPFIFV